MHFKSGTKFGFVKPFGVSFIVSMMLIYTGLNFANAEDSSPVPIPSKKPTIPVIYANYNVEIFDATQHTKNGVPVPSKRPDFTQPKIGTLLSFGKPPVPKKRPIGVRSASLSDHDAQLYREIFKYQANGAWDKADNLINQLDDFRLRGHVLYQRYMHPKSERTSFEQLVGWLDLYADHPGADRIHTMAMGRTPSDFQGHVNKPRNKKQGKRYLSILSNKAKTYQPRTSRNASQKQQVQDITKTVHRHVSKGAPTQALTALKAAKADKTLDQVEYDQLLSHVARGYLTSGRFAEARSAALEAASRSAENAPIAGWVGGLVAWREGNYKLAAPLFELTAISPYVSSWTSSAGAYWASRAHMRAGNTAEVNKWLQAAAAHPRTFYGLIATRALGWDFDFDWDIPELTDQRRVKLFDKPAGSRADALVKAGQFHLAEEELRQVLVTKDPELKKAVIAYSQHEDLPSLSMELAEGTLSEKGGVYDVAYYPIAPWQPHSDYRVDRALINAIIRQESRFRPYAENKRSGATGLMQLMPRTANYIAKKFSYRVSSGQHRLKDPQVNLDIGQRYIEDLMDQDAVGDDLFSLAMAYNAGPGNLRKWKREHQNIYHDPLLFVETIPMPETRAFVERVMANLWIYRLRLGQDTPSLDSVVSGGWAQYVKLDIVGRPPTSKKASYERRVPAPTPKPYELATTQTLP